MANYFVFRTESSIKYTKNFPTFESENFIISKFGFLTLEDTGTEGTATLPKINYGKKVKYTTRVWHLNSGFYTYFPKGHEYIFGPVSESKLDEFRNEENFTNTVWKPWDEV